MITLTLTLEQQEILLDLLECSAADIHTEIVHTDNHSYKALLKERKQAVLGMLEQLRSIQPAISETATIEDIPTR